MVFKNIKLRAPEPEDLQLLYEWENDTDLWQLSNTITPFSKYTLKKYIENSSLSIFETLQLRLMIDIKSSGKTIGTVDLFDFDPINMRAGVGILIADQSSRRKGFATSALEAVVDYSFSKLNLHQLYCNILSDNRESIGLFTGIGFMQTGTKQEWIRSGDSFKDELFLQLLSSGYKS